MTARVLVAGGDDALGRVVLAKLGERGVAGAGIINKGGRFDPAIFENADAIINCAGRNIGTPAEIDEANVAYPTALARAARAAGVPRFIQVSSFSVYGKAEEIDRDSALAPDSDYGRSKVVAEQTIAQLASDRFHPVSVRLPFCFSSNEPAMLGRLIAMMLRLRVLPTPPAGSSRRSMITYVGAANALVALALSRELPDTLLAAADPEPLDLTALVGILRERFNRRITILPLPNALTACLRPVVPGIVDRLLRSSVLAPSANLLWDGTPYPVAAELDAYLDRLPR